MTARKRPRPSQSNAHAAPGGAGGEGGARRRFRPGGLLAACGVLLVAIAVLYPELVFRGRIFFSSDNQASAAFTAVGREILAEGSYPVWNPYVFSGMPSFGSLACIPYVYPVNFVLGLFVRYAFFPEYSWLLFHTFLTGLGTFLLVRGRGARPAAAIAAGVLMMWMPNLVAVGANGHGSQACAVAYLPLALWLWDRIWRGRGVVVNGAALAIVLGLSMLRGHLQVSYYTYLLVGMHLVFFAAAALVDAARGKTPPAESALPRSLLARVSASGARQRVLAETGFAVGVLAAVAVVSFLICAVLYVPVHDYAQYSIRGASSAGGTDYRYATAWSLHPTETLTFLVPHSFGFGKELYLGQMPFTDYPNYLGVVVLAFTAVALAGARTRWVAFLAVTAVVTTLVSFGKFVPVLYDPMFRLLPYFNKFRVPVMILIVQQLAVVGLFAAGLDAVLARGAGARRWALRGVVAGGVAFLAALFSQGYWTGGFVLAAASHVRATQDPAQQRMVARLAGEFLARDLVQVSLIALLLAGAAFAFAARRRASAPLFASVVLLLGAVDYYRVDRYILHPERFLGHDAYRVIRDPAETRRFSEPDPMMEFLRAQPGPFRIFPMDGPDRPFSGLWGSNRFMMFDVASIGGYHPAKLSAYQDYIQALGSNLAAGRLDLVNLLNTRYLVSGSPLPDHPLLKPVWRGVDFENQPRTIYENLAAFPRAWIAGAYRVADAEQTLALLAAGEVDVRHTVLLEHPPSVQPEGGDSAVVQVVKWRPQEVVFAVELARPGILVASEIFYPEWRATVDGAPAEVMRADHALRAVALGAGRHEVAFHYDASLLRRSAVVSIGAFVLTLATLAGAVVRGRRARWKPSS